MNYAQYVGRVGGLAVALGVGLWIASPSGTAYADSTDPEHSSHEAASSASDGGSDSGGANGTGSEPGTASTTNGSHPDSAIRPPRDVPQRPTNERGGGGPSVVKPDPSSARGATENEVDSTTEKADDEVTTNLVTSADTDGMTNQTARSHLGNDAHPVAQSLRVSGLTGTNGVPTRVAQKPVTTKAVPVSANDVPTARTPDVGLPSANAVQATSSVTRLPDSSTSPDRSVTTPVATASTLRPAALQPNFDSRDVDEPLAPVQLQALWTALTVTKRELDNFATAFVRNVDVGLAAFTATSSAGGAESTGSIVAKSVATTNSAPTSGTPTFGTPNSSTGTVSGALNFVDPDGNTLTYTVSSAPAGGKLTLNADGTFVYAPTNATRLRAGSTLAADYDRFVVTASDGQATASVTVDAPIYSAQLSTGAATQVGLSPAGVVAFGDRMYTANTLGNNITAVDTRTNSTIATIPVGQAPKQLALSPDGNVLYVTNSGSNTLSVISTVSGATLATLAVGQSPQGVAVNPAGNRVYVTNSASNTVTVLNASTGSIVATVSVGNTPVGVIVNGDGTRAYITNRGSNTVSVISTVTQSVTTTYAVGSMPQALALTASGKLYVTNSGSDNVTVVNTNNGQTIATVAVRDQPFGITLNKDQSLAYVANSDATVSVIATASSTKLTGTLAVETATGSMVAMSPDGKKLYVTNTAGTTVRSASLIHVDPPPSNPGSATSAVTDDFTGSAGSAPNSTLWSYHLGAGGATGQLNAYTNSPRNASLDGNGNLVITAIEEPVNVPGYGTYDYSSAWLTTEDKLEFTYGTLSARIKLPAEQGLLPALWMLGSDVETVGWPLGGEIDIIEQTNTGQFAGSTIHGPGGYALSTAVPSGTSTDFHEYWVHWEPNKITTGIDDQTLGVYTPDSLPPGTPWTFNDRSMYAILSLAVGSPFGQPDDTTDLPAEMVVDWVRYTPLS